jgi:hypothetical protein
MAMGPKAGGEGVGLALPFSGSAEMRGRQAVPYGAKPILFEIIPI